MAVRYFGERESAAKRGLQIWMVLVAASAAAADAHVLPICATRSASGAPACSRAFGPDLQLTAGRKTCRA